MALFGQAREVFAEHFATPNETHQAVAWFLILLLFIFLLWVLHRVQKEHHRKEESARNLDAIASILRIMGMIAVLYAFFQMRG